MLLIILIIENIGKNSLHLDKKLREKDLVKSNKLNMINDLRKKMNKLINNQDSIIKILFNFMRYAITKEHSKVTNQLTD